MAKRAVALGVAVVASACGGRPHAMRAGSALDPKQASTFWCASTGQCFTAETDCVGLACSQWNRASCAVYYDGGYPRFMCGVDEGKCNRLKEQLSVRDVGECIMRSATAHEVEAIAAAETLAPALDDEVESFPTVQRDYVIAPSALGQVELGAVPAGNAAWELRVVNNSDDTVLVVWDESTFVTKGQESRGRLLRHETVDLARQAPSPVAPHSQLTEEIFIEKLDAAALTEMVLGGRMVVTLQLPRGKMTWSGVVQPR